jgi:hypothetical protein
MLAVKSFPEKNFYIYLQLLKLPVFACLQQLNKVINAKTVQVVTEARPFNSQQNATTSRQ